MNRDLDPSFGKWRRAGVTLRAVYRLSEQDLDRIGNCWMKGRLLVDDLVMPLTLAGDGFYDYALIQGGSMRGQKTVDERGEHSYTICKGVTFGAYVMGTLHDEQPTEREFYRLITGEPTTFSDRIDVEKATAEAEAASAAENGQALDAAVARMKADAGSNP